MKRFDRISILYKINYTLVGNVELNMCHYNFIYFVASKKPPKPPSEKDSSKIVWWRSLIPVIKCTVSQGKVIFGNRLLPSTLGIIKLIFISLSKRITSNSLIHS